MDTLANKHNMELGNTKIDELNYVQSSLKISAYPLFLNLALDFI